jgi:hypothetical protein
LWSFRRQTACCWHDEIEIAGMRASADFAAVPHANAFGRFSSRFLVGEEEPAASRLQLRMDRGGVECKKCR